MLAFFAASDGIVVENLGVRFLSGESIFKCTQLMLFVMFPCWDPLSPPGLCCPAWCNNAPLERSSNLVKI